MGAPSAKQNIARPFRDTTARARTIHATLPDKILSRVYNAEDEQSAFEAARQIPHIDTARRIHAYIDIYSTFQEAMSDESCDELKEVIITDLLEFSGKRLPLDAALQAEVPDDFIELSPLTGVIDYVDIEASFRVWDEIDRGVAMKNIINAFISQFGTLSSGNARQAVLLKKAFSISVENGTKVVTNERDLLRQLQSTGSVNRFTDDEAQEKSLRIAAERDMKRKLARTIL